MCARITQKDLVTIYVMIVRPVLECACPVWHINLPQYVSDNIEIIQRRALKFIFPGLGYAEIFRCVNLNTLKVRRTAFSKNRYDIRQVNVYTCYQYPEQIDSVTPLYRGDYTTANKHGTAEYSRLIRYHMCC
ncbi:hypothetical protein NP493_86g03046 [Ridgeia piscesae]|uniref:Uncharacterized protein n=1 Tax=Ridgeia piscesae TaxID=27915 RepID=A0AAD9P8F5_RIDPI|nr:hypothetical protein NP493_86g03046 [Ridgeia piscesae]